MSPRRLLPLEDRFWAQVDRRDDEECWPWRGRMTWGGYGTIALLYTPRTVVRVAHRVAYELEVGPVPAGLQLDHLCRNRACVNPRHLEPVTCRENLLRGETRAAANAAKTHCLNGHPFDERNTYRRCGGPRQCKTCQRERTRRFRAARSAA